MYRLKYQVRLHSGHFEHQLTLDKQRAPRRTAGRGLVSLREWGCRNCFGRRLLSRKERILVGAWFLEDVHGDQVVERAKLQL